MGFLSVMSPKLTDHYNYLQILWKMSIVGLCPRHSELKFPKYRSWKLIVFFQSSR